MKNLTSIFLLASILVATRLMAAPPEGDNYRGVIQGVIGKFDGAYQDGNPQGKPAQRALAIVETFLTAMNDIGVKGPNEYHVFMKDEDAKIGGCSVASNECQELKILVRNSTHHADSTLF